MMAVMMIVMVVVMQVVQTDRGSLSSAVSCFGTVASGSCQQDGARSTDGHQS